MTRWRVISRAAIFTMLSLALAGCLPSSEGNLDEQKDPHYLNGRNLVTTLDYKGAMEEFEKALETNPHNSSAHLELALLCEEQTKDYAAAIYHYEQHLKLRPKSDYAERAKERIKSCKMDLVKTEILGPVNQGMQQELERLRTDNMQLKQQVENLRAQLAGQPLSSPVSTNLAQRSPVEIPRPQQTVTARTVETVELRAAPPGNRSEPPPSQQPLRVYTIKAGDKLTSIARSHGVDLSKLMAANPGVDPSRLQIGQKINIP